MIANLLRAVSDDFMSPRTLALWQLSGAVLLSSLTALFAKLIPLPVVQIIFWRSVVAALAIWLFLRTTRGVIQLASWREYLFFLGSGSLLAVHWLTYFHSIQLSTVAIGIIALYTHPVITIVLEPFFDKARHRGSDICVGMVVFGGVFLMAPAFELSNSTTRGICWGVLSALVYSIRNIIIRKHVRKYPAPTVMLYQVIASVIVLLPFMISRFEVYPGKIVGQLILLGVVFTAIHHTLFVAVLKHFSVKTASVIASVQPALAAVFAWLILDEIPGLRVVIGGLIVISAAAFETSRNMSRSG